MAYDDIPRRIPPESESILTVPLPKSRLTEIALDRSLDEAARGAVFMNPNADTEFCQDIADTLYRNNKQEQSKFDDWVIGQLMTSPHINDFTFDGLNSLNSFRLPFMLADNAAAEEVTLINVVLNLLARFNDETDADRQRRTLEQIYSLLLHQNIPVAFMEHIHAVHGFFNPPETAPTLTIRPVAVRQMFHKVLDNETSSTAFLFTVLLYTEAFESYPSAEKTAPLIEKFVAHPVVQAEELKKLYVHLTGRNPEVVTSNVFQLIVDKLKTFDEFNSWPSEWIHAHMKAS